MNKKISPLEAYKISAVLEDVSYKIILSTKRSCFIVCQKVVILGPSESKPWRRDDRTDV